jgi:hypothetical protein
MKHRSGLRNETRSHPQPGAGASPAPGPHQANALGRLTSLQQLLATLVNKSFNPWAEITGNNHDGKFRGTARGGKPQTR